MSRLTATRTTGSTAAREDQDRFQALAPSSLSRSEKSSVIKLALAVLTSRYRPGRAFTSPEDIEGFLRLKLTGRRNEVFGIIYLDTRHRLIKIEELFNGTGRSRRVLRIVDAAGERLALKTRPASANLSETAAFMDGSKKILVFSMAGGTGRSYHADLGCEHTARRVITCWNRAGGRSRRSRDWAARIARTRRPRRSSAR